MQDLCIGILLDHCTGILLDNCIRILLDNLCKICVSGSLCEDPLDHLYQDPAGALSLFKISCGPLVSSLRSTCARSLFQDPFRPLLRGSCKTTCARSLYQGPLDRLCQDPVRPLVQDLCIGILLDHIRIRLDNLCKICLRISV